jgi:sterol desaturase/sphingolipid hydroxylase (fatty acid hydroxylase superfamily)
VFVSELLAEVVNLVAHGNVRLGGERFWRGWLITPDLHRIHHSQEAADYEANFGQTFSVWDRMFGTYRGEPALGEAGMVMGVRGRNCVAIWAMLTAPFRAR